MTHGVAILTCSLKQPSNTAEIERKTMQLTAKLQVRIGDQPIDMLTWPFKNERIDTRASLYYWNNIMRSPL